MYFQINLLIAVGFLFWQIPFKIAEKGARIRPSQILTLGHIILMAALLIPGLMMIVPRQSVTFPSLQIWSAPSLDGPVGKTIRDTAFVSFSNIPKITQWAHIGILREFLLALILCGSITMVIRFGLAQGRLSRIVNSSHPIRRIRRVRILINDETIIPFSFWRPGRAYVILPSAVLTDPCQYRLAMLHELQHHRQGDTLWVHLFQFLKFGFFWNPVLQLWENKISTLQEFACDEALVSTKGVSPYAYGSCLVKAAEQCLNSHCLPVGTTGMAVGTSAKTLKRRIDMMFDYKSKKVTRVGRLTGGTLAIAIVGAIATMATVAFASQGLIKDRRITLADAQDMARNAARGSQFPITVNQAVVDQLNRYLGTPDGRAFIRDSLARMQNYRPMIDAKIQSYSLPEELSAIPIVESGYKNMKRSHSAGLWMFIVQTARNYDMRVDDQIDDRLNVDVETDAAMRYLESNYLRFKDWQLAVLAYNTGESRVQQGIDETGSRDAWKIIEAGYDNDPNYLPIVMASILILKNPAVLD